MLATFAKWFIDGVILMPLIMGGTKKKMQSSKHISMASIYMYIAKENKQGWSLL